jgi:hypothetical protein
MSSVNTFLPTIWSDLFFHCNMVHAIFSGVLLFHTIAFSAHLTVSVTAFLAHVILELTLHATSSTNQPSFLNHCSTGLAAALPHLSQSRFKNHSQ